MSAPWTPATLPTSSLDPPSPPRRLTTSSSDLSARLRHEETATPGRGTDREPSGVSVRAERPSLARATRSTRIRQALATNGDIPHGRVRVLPGGGIRRRRGQQSRPPTRRMPPAAQKCPRTRRMSPAAAPEYGASLASRATGAPTAPAPTSNHDLRAPHRSQKRPSRGRRDRLQGKRLPALRCRLPSVGGECPTLTGRGGSPLSQQPGAFGEDRQVHPVTGTDPLLRTAQVGLDG